MPPTLDLFGPGYIKCMLAHIIAVFQCMGPVNSKIGATPPSNLLTSEDSFKPKLLRLSKIRAVML
ncbi:hypothetical protein ACTXT7_010013 [Hymenolepis weldensis]